jgi:hypothetical protein
MTLKLFLIFNSKRNNNTKPRTAWESYWRHLNGFFTVFSIAKQNSNKTRTVWVSYWGQPFTLFCNNLFQSNFLLFQGNYIIVVKLTNDKNQPCFCGKATVQISSKWHSNCPCLVIVFFCKNSLRVILETTERLLYRIFNSKAKQ